MKKTLLNFKQHEENILTRLKEEYLKKQYSNTDTINVSISVKDIIESSTAVEPTIYLTDTAYVKMRTLIDGFTTEVAWHFLVKKVNNESYMIYDVLVFPQTVTGATATSIDGEYEMWIAKQPDEVFEFIRGHGHSHVNMGVTPSGVDEGYYLDLLTQVKDFYITFIMNKSGAYTLRLYDVTNNVLYSDMKYVLISSITGAAFESWLEEEKKVVKTYQAPTPLPPSAPYAYSNYGKKKEKEKVNTFSKMKDAPDLTKKTTTTSVYHLSGPELTDIYECKTITNMADVILSYYVALIYEYDKNVTEFASDITDALLTKTTIGINLDTLDVETDTNKIIMSCDIWEYKRGE